MGQQLVATQESFARISEEAAGRLQDISGKVVASEANVNNGSEALKLQIKQLEAQLQEQGKQQVGVAGQATELDQRLAQMTASTTDLSNANSKLQGQVQALTEAVATLKAAQGDVKELSADVAALKKQGNPSAAIARIEQDLVVLKSAQDSQPVNSDALEVVGAGSGRCELADRDGNGGVLRHALILPHPACACLDSRTPEIRVRLLLVPRGGAVR